jgi:hypothetical protein
VTDESREKWVETRRRCEPKFALDSANRFCGQEESRGVLQGGVGANVEGENVSRIRITVEQWGQRKPGVGSAVDGEAGDGSE